MFWTRKKIIILVLILAVIVASVTIFYLWYSKTPTEPADLGPGSISQKRVLQYQAPELSIAEKNEREVINIARSFTERFGTASNQFKGNNLLDVSHSMTDSFYQWASSKYQASLLAELGENGSYASITTEALAAEVKDLQANQAEVIVETQRQKTVTGQETINYKQDIRLKLVKQNDQWKIDGAYWQ